MKKLSLLTIIACGAGLLLSSCSRLENISVSKRHYRSGYYVDLGSRKNDVKPAGTTEKATAVNLPSKPATQVDGHASASPDNLKPIEQVAVAPAGAPKHTRKHASAPIYAGNIDASTAANDVQKESVDNYFNSMPDANAARASDNSTSIPYWLLIVFCFLLPPLAVGLKFGIIDKFWISVVLTILFWVPGIVYALIVVTQ